MRIWLVPAAAMLLAACSDTPTESKPSEPPAAPVTGRQAFQSTFPSARTWAPDARPLRVRSLNLDQVKSGDGKAGAWEIAYVSEQMSRARPFTWSAVEAEGNLHKGVFKGLEEPWTGSSGQQQPFSSAALKVDTPEALKAAVAKSSDYLDKPGTKPTVSFLLEYTPRFPDPVWRVMWGASASTAQYTVFVDATSGSVVGKE